MARGSISPLRERSKAHTPHQYATPGTMNDGEELWNKLVKKHDFAFVFCGHIATDDSPTWRAKTRRGRPRIRSCPIFKIANSAARPI